jgi:hypothetical protein
MKYMAVVLGLVVAILLAPLPAHAYIDPNSGSLMLQAILGGAAGLAVFVRLYWHKLVRMIRLRKSNRVEPSD